MQSFLKFIAWTILLVLIFILHFVILSILPYPFNRLNIIFLALVWLIFFVGNPRVLLLVLPMAFFLELFSTAPFGLLSFALIVSLSALSWFLFNIFTNRSIFIVFLSGFLGIVVYRLLFFGTLFVVDFFIKKPFAVTTTMLPSLLYEASFTAVILTLFYLITSSFIKRLNPRYVKIEYH